MKGTASIPHSPWEFVATGCFAGYAIVAIVTASSTFELLAGIGLLVLVLALAGWSHQTHRKHPERLVIRLPGGLLWGLVAVVALLVSGDLPGGDVSRQIRSALLLGGLVAGALAGQTRPAPDPRLLESVRARKREEEPGPISRLMMRWRLTRPAAEAGIAGVVAICAVALLADIPLAIIAFDHHRPGSLLPLIAIGIPIWAATAIVTSYLVEQYQRGNWPPAFMSVFNANASSKSDENQRHGDTR
jgi:hypothetical protein